MDSTGEREFLPNSTLKEGACGAVGRLRRARIRRGRRAFYKQLAVVGKAFRSLKSVDLKVRLIYHHWARRIKRHIFLCMLAYYVHWHMKDKLPPMLFAEEEPAPARWHRHTPPPKTQSKARTIKTSDGARATTFQSLMSHLAQLGKFKLV